MNGTNTTSPPSVDDASSTPPPAKRMKGSANTIQGQFLPRLDMEDLFTGTAVDIIVKAAPDSEESQTFSVNRAFLCGYSEYFAGAFNSGFAEAEKKSIELNDVEPWVFRCFLGWLYTRTICYHPAGFDDAEILDSFMKPVGITEDSNEYYENDSITWSYTGLVTLYIFADQYDCRRFRQAVFEIIQTKALQLQPTKYRVPYAETIAYACNHLLKENNLRQFFTALWVERLDTLKIQRGEPEEALTVEEWNTLPKDFLVECMMRINRKHASLRCEICSTDGNQSCNAADHRWEDAVRPSGDYWCRYHKHEGEEERSVCVEKYRRHIKWRMRSVEGYSRHYAGDPGEDL